MIPKRHPTRFVETLDIITRSLPAESEYEPLRKEQFWPNDDFHVLIGCMLSHMTTYKNCHKACMQLFEKVRVPSELQDMPLDQIMTLVRPAGFAGTKARNIKCAANLICAKWNGQVPHDTLSLNLIRGVGPKTIAAFQAAQCGMATVTVDVHVERITWRLGWRDASLTQRDTQSELMKLFPKEKWNEINDTLVRFGRATCQKEPHCDKCVVAARCYHRNRNTMTVRERLDYMHGLYGE